MGCRRKAPAPELVRLVRTEGGGLLASRTAPGRGAWLCPPAVGEEMVAAACCIGLARRRNAFARALRDQVTTEAIDALRASTGKRARIEGRGD